MATGQLKMNFDGKTWIGTGVSTTITTKDNRTLAVVESSANCFVQIDHTGKRTEATDIVFY